MGGKRGGGAWKDCIQWIHVIRNGLIILLLHYCNRIKFQCSGLADLTLKLIFISADVNERHERTSEE